MTCYVQPFCIPRQVQSQRLPFGSWIYWKSFKDGIYPLHLGKTWSSYSKQGFQEQSLNNAAKSMRLELNRMIEQIPKIHPQYEQFHQQMDHFFELFLRYLDDKAQGEKL